MVVLDPASAEHWLAVQEFRRSWDIDPDDAFGADGYVITVVDGQTMLRITAAGLRRIEELAVRTGGPGELAWLDQLGARMNDQRRV